MIIYSRSCALNMKTAQLRIVIDAVHVAASVMLNLCKTIFLKCKQQLSDWSESANICDRHLQDILVLNSSSLSRVADVIQ